MRDDGENILPRVGAIDRRARASTERGGADDAPSERNVWTLRVDADARAEGADGRDLEDDPGVMTFRTLRGGVESGRGRWTGAAEALGGDARRARAAFVSDDACVAFGSDGRGVLISDVFRSTGGRTRAISGGEEDGTRAPATCLAATEGASGRASAVVGDADGTLYEVVGDLARQDVSIKPFDRSNRSHWVDDMHDDEAESESAPGSPTKTPGKSRAWGAIRSATAAAGLLLSRKANAGGVRSLSFVGGSSETKRRLLACIADGVLEEWSIDVSAEPKPPTLAHAHKLGKKIQRALRTSSNLAFVAADWTLTKEGVDITVLVECDGLGSLHRFKRAHGTNSMEFVASAVPAAGALPRSLLRVRLFVDGEDTFVLSPDGSAVIFSGVDFSRVLARMDVSNHEPILDVACIRPGEWVLLSQDGSVTTFNPHARQLTPRRVGKVTPSRRTSRADAPSAMAVDDADAIESVRHEFEEYFAGHIGSREQTKSRLRASGAFLSDASPFATLSKGLIDALPKKLSGKSTRGGPTIEEHGAEKMNRYLSFLNFLMECGVWNEIDSEERAHILMHGEMISAVLRLLDLKNVVDDEARAMLEEVVTHAGAAIKSTDSALDERSDLEVCFSRSSEAGLLFPAIKSILEKQIAKERDLEKRTIILDTCARGLLVPLEAANDFRRRRTTMYPPTVSVGVNWMFETEAREALRAISSVSIKLHAEATSSSSHVGLGPVLGSRLLASAALLLDACAAFLSASLLHSTERIEAHEEYVSSRDLVLPALMTCAKQSATVPQHARPQFGALTEGADVTIESVAAVAEAHFGYAELFEICDTADGTARLHHYMRTLLGAHEDGEESFAHFVYRKLAIEQNRDAALLRELPTEFHGDLERFLAPHPHLRWLMELRMGKYAEASETLAAIGNAAKGNEKSRTLSMAKLALLAAGGVESDEKIAEIDAALAA